jgi:hypothetical protein
LISTLNEQIDCSYGVCASSFSVVNGLLNTPAGQAVPPPYNAEIIIELFLAVSTTGDCPDLGNATKLPTNQKQ